MHGLELLTHIRFPKGRGWYSQAMKRIFRQNSTSSLESCKFAATLRKLAPLGNTWIQRCRTVGNPGFLPRSCPGCATLQRAQMNNANFVCRGFHDLNDGLYQLDQLVSLSITIRGNSPSYQLRRWKSLVCIQGMKDSYASAGVSAITQYLDFAATILILWHLGCISDGSCKSQMGFFIGPAARATWLLEDRFL